MELRDLRVYLAVVDAGGFTRAAKRVHMVQSSVSDAIARLESEFCVALLERRRFGVRPTPAGEVLTRWARLLTNVADRTVSEVTGARAESAGRVGLGLLPTITPLVLPSLLAKLGTEQPKVELRVHEGLAPDLVEGVRTAEIDLAVLFFPTQTVPELDFVEVSERPLSLMTSAAHPLAAQRVAHLTDCVLEGWVTYPPQNPGRLWLEQACRRAGFAPRITAEVETATQQQIFVEAGAGIAMVPFQDKRLHAGRARLVQLAAPHPEFRIGYVHDPRTATAAVATARAGLEEILSAG
jgi:DNA-binding transcriptional LysR family regulator